jgi:hypothetical protein
VICSSRGLLCSWNLVHAPEASGWVAHVKVSILEVAVLVEASTPPACTTAACVGRHRATASWLVSVNKVIDLREFWTPRSTWSSSKDGCTSRSAECSSVQSAEQKLSRSRLSFANKYGPRYDAIELKPGKSQPQLRPCLAAGCATTRQRHHAPAPAPAPTTSQPQPQPQGAAHACFPPSALPLNSDVECDRVRQPRRSYVRSRPSDGRPLRWPGLIAFLLIGACFWRDHRLQPLFCSQFSSQALQRPSLRPVRARPVRALPASPTSSARAAMCTFSLNFYNMSDQR